VSSLFTRREGRDANASVDVSARVAMMEIPVAFRFGIMYSDKWTRTRDTRANKRNTSSGELMVLVVGCVMRIRTVEGTGVN
jgi:hypothetical protein